MRKIILFIVAISLSGRLFPVAQRGLKWENMNCWMISVLSALINTKPLYEMLKDYKDEILPTDPPELKISKAYITMMNESFKPGADAVLTSDFYKKIYELTHDEEVIDKAGKKTKVKVRNYGFEWSSFAKSGEFIERFLKDINITYPELQKIFFIALRDSMNADECYNNDIFCHRTCSKNYSSSNFKIDTTLGFCLDSDNNNMDDIGNPFDLVKCSFFKFESKSYPYGPAKPEICVKEKCGTVAGFKRISFTAFLKAPRIMIFENTKQSDKYGVKIPPQFKIPKSFFVNPNHSSPNYKVYSIVIGSGSHFWNYSRDIDSNDWWKYDNYDIKPSGIEPVANGTVENIMKTGFDKGKVPVLIFYEMENYEQYKLQANLSDLKESLRALKTKLSELKSKLGLLKSKLVAH